MTKLLQCDKLIFQSLEDLKSACVEAGDEKCPVRDFEVGVFCGRYKSAVPEEYFGRSKREHGNKKRKSTALDGDDRDAGAFMVASSGPINVTLPPAAPASHETHDMGYQDDIRYVSPFVMMQNMAKLTDDSIHNFAKP